jgi:hypothetical protein
LTAGGITTQFWQFIRKREGFVSLGIAVGAGRDEQETLVTVKPSA